MHTFTYTDTNTKPYVCPDFISMLFPVSHWCTFYVELWSNIALYGTATQSSVDPLTKPEFAIDGNVDGDMGHRSCIRSYIYEDYPWWKVSFNYNVFVREVTIVNRADCCGKFLNGVIYQHICFLADLTMYTCKSNS